MYVFAVAPRAVKDLFGVVFGNARPAKVLGVHAPQMPAPAGMGGLVTIFRRGRPRSDLTHRAASPSSPALKIDVPVTRLAAAERPDKALVAIVISVML